MLYHFVVFVLSLRRLVFVRQVVCCVFVFLLVAGVWVATQALSAPSLVDINDKLIHVVVFFGFAVLIDFASLHPSFWWWKGIPLLIYGACIEIMQYFTPERSFSLLDWWADFVGILLYFVMKKGCLWIMKNRVVSF